MTDRRNYSYYTDGSAARKIEKRSETHTREVSEHSRKYTAIRRRRFNAISVLFTAAAIVASMYLCISYIMSYSNITAMTKEISSLQSQIADISADNDEAYKEIDASVDLETVYNKATKEFGMVPAGKGQVYKYKNKKSDRVIQYSDIPE